MEWINKYNSFNSLKGLSYYENYKAIMRWMDGESYLPPPVECNLDPYAECNLSCYFCIGQRYLKYNREEVGKMRQLPVDYMCNLVKFLAEWGVRGLCVSGGGEPSFHKDIPEVIRLAVHNGMDVAFVTNGTHLTDELAEALMLCRWVSFSVDAAFRSTYRVVKGINRYNDVIGNITRLSVLRKESKSNVDLCFKFLILPENSTEIHLACQLAKELGVQDFHARPVDFERPDMVGARPLPLDIVVIQEQLNGCHREETDDFHVYTVTHKYDSKFHVKHDFKSCLATPLVIPILTDGNAYLCVDKKMESGFKIGSCCPNPYDVLKWWGSDAHRDLVKSVDINKCSRCTWSQYHQQVENVILKDKMCLSFP